MDLDFGKRLEEENREEEERQAKLAEESLTESAEGLLSTEPLPSEENTGENIVPETNPEPENKKSSEVKYIVIALVVIIAIFVVAMGGMHFYEQASVTGASISFNLQELHRENLAGNLAEDRGYVYNGFSVVKYNGLWYTRKENENQIIEFPLHFGPREVEEITINGTLALEFNQGEEVFMAIDPKIANKYYSLALSEINLNIVKGLNRKPVGSCTTEDVICEEREIVSCNDTKGLPVIELVLGEETGIYPQGTCIKIVGNDENLVKAADRLLLQWYKVIEQ